MKFLFSISIMSVLLFSSINSSAQTDKSKRPSPPVSVTQKVGNASISINYSQPSVKGRTIGIDLEPLPGKVWRAGANEATVFETDKDLVVGDKNLPKGKYGFFVLMNEQSWTFIFNKTPDQWGAFKYKEADDVLRVTASEAKAQPFSEKLTYKIDTDGKMHLLWGDKDIQVQIKEKK